MLVSDLVCIFSNFDYDAYASMNSDILSDEQKFIDNFNGIQISLENLFFMEKLKIKHWVKSQRLGFKLMDAEA